MEHKIQTPFTHQHTQHEEDELSQTALNSSSSSPDQVEEEIIVWKPKQRNKQQKRGTPQVCIEGYIEEDDVPTRTKSLTGDDLVELKGCLDLGFGFSYHEIPELCNTLPALELCYSMSQKYDHHQHQQHESFCGGLSKGVDCSGSGSDSSSVSGSESSSPVPTWKISSPGDHPEDVKARLKFWAQAVACTVKLCT